MVHDTNFLITAGYDSHGANKPDIPLGMDVPTDSAFESTAIEMVRKG